MLSSASPFFTLLLCSLAFWIASAVFLTCFTFSDVVGSDFSGFALLFGSAFAIAFSAFFIASCSLSTIDYSTTSFSSLATILSASNAFFPFLIASSLASSSFSFFLRVFSYFYTDALRAATAFLALATVLIPIPLGDAAIAPSPSPPS